MRFHPRYYVLSFVLIALFTVSVVSRLLAPYASNRVNSRLVNETARYVHDGIGQHIDWYPLSDRAIKLARRLDRPMLLAIANPWSFTARQMDRNLFASPTVQLYLAREFVCIRIDGLECPDWVGAYLPYQRLQEQISPDFQMWVVDPTGRMFQPLSRHGLGGIPTEKQFLAEIANDLQSLQSLDEQKDGGVFSPDAPGVHQANNLAALSKMPDQLLPNLSNLGDSMVQASPLDHGGGFPIAQTQYLRPDAWRYLLMTQGVTTAEPSLLPMLKSPTHDLLDGGFFRGSTTQDWMHPAYDKVAVLNAEMASLLAALSVRASNDDYRSAAAATLDSLTGEFVNADGMLRACRYGDERSWLGRSRRSSFSPTDLRQIFPSGPELDYARDHLGLRVESNPGMTPYLTDFSQIGTPEYTTVMERLRSNAAHSDFSEEVTMETGGTSIARMFEAARVLGDASALAKTEDLFNHLDVLVQGDDVVHEIGASERALPTFGDYLAYSDAALQDYLTFSRVVSLERGVAVLRRGLFLYGGLGQGAYRMGNDASFHRAFPDSNVAQLCDDCGESQMARSIRLCWAYGRLLAHSSNQGDRAAAADLTARASATVSQFSDISTNLSFLAAGYASASALQLDDTIVLCAGSDPEPMVRTLVMREPFRVVAPVAGPVYPDLQRRKGYYLFRQGALKGPLTLDKVCDLLTPTIHAGS